MQSGSEFHILTMRLEKEWPSRADELCDLMSFLELPLVTRVEEKVIKKVRLSACVIIEHISKSALVRR